MKFLFDYFPIICFFIAYKLWGIFVATAVTMVASALQIGVYWLKHRKFEKMHLITFVLIILLGGSTLIFHKAIFIKWKPSIVYWLFAIALLTTHVVGKSVAMERMLGDKIKIPSAIWKRLNFAWALFFIFLGALNLYVVYHFNTDEWVYFKLFGTLILMVLFLIGQGFYLYKYIEKDPSDNHKDKESKS